MRGTVLSAERLRAGGALTLEQEAEEVEGILRTSDPTLLEAIARDPACPALFRKVALDRLVTLGKGHEAVTRLLADLRRGPDEDEEVKEVACLIADALRGRAGGGGTAVALPVATRTSRHGPPTLGFVQVSSGVDWREDVRADPSPVIRWLASLPYSRQA